MGTPKHSPTPSLSSSSSSSSHPPTANPNNNTTTNVSAAPIQRPSFNTPEGKYILKDELASERVVYPKFASVQVSFVTLAGLATSSFLTSASTLSESSSTLTSSIPSNQRPNQISTTTSTKQRTTPKTLAEANSTSNLNPRTLTLAMHPEFVRAAADAGRFVEIPISTDSTGDKGSFMLVPPLKSAVSSIFNSKDQSYSVNVSSSGIIGSAKKGHRSSSAHANSSSETPSQGSSILGRSSISTPPTSNSLNSLVARITALERLGPLFAHRPPGNVYMLFNAARNFMWADYQGFPKDPLAIVFFRPELVVTCHDLNSVTARDDMGVIMGFSSGDILWYAPLAGKFARFNRNGVWNASAVTCIKWLPGSESLFIAGFEDGALLVLDKDKEDQSFTPPSSAPVTVPPAPPYCATPHTTSSQASTTSSTTPHSLRKPVIFSVHKPPKQKYNPVTLFCISTSPITSLAFSPDCTTLALTTQDGHLRVLDYIQERLLDSYKSYYGALHSCDFSPDGRFILTGGQDDLVTVYAFRGRVLLRCQGHSSFVTCVKFDPFLCSDKTYRFGSVGEDGKLLLWEFSKSSLYPTRKHHHTSNSYSSTANLIQTLKRVLPRPDLNDVVHPTPSKAEVPIVEPFMTSLIHDHALGFLTFRDDCLVTSSKWGIVRIWERPRWDDDADS